MGTTLRARVAAPDRTRAIAAIERVFAEVRRLEQVLSTWRDDSELGRLNRAPVGRAFNPSPEVFSLLLEVQCWWRATGGAFDPAIGPLVEAWDLRGAGRYPSESVLGSALAASGLDRFSFEEEARAIRRLDARAWIDDGAFGKGAALRAARRILLQGSVRSALLDFGGQLLALGDAAGDGGWVVAVAHPSRRDEPAAEVRLRDRSAATTSSSERFVEVSGERFGHVLDPRTGRPVRPWGSVTVVAPDPLVADILSTALFVLGPVEALRWAEAREDVAVLVLENASGAPAASSNRAMAGLLVDLGPAREVTGGDSRIREAEKTALRQVERAGD
ncbi:MAG: FAD:protein FMN transferase [Gemmatimonadetes bacterium]|nr:FAD:protein FMN transferase [Gemmatimonadota bacterium]